MSNGMLLIFCWFSLICWKLQHAEATVECSVCEDDDCVYSNCYCKRTVTYHTRTYFDRWNQRYETEKLGISQVSVECLRLHENSILSKSTCPEEQCGNITFTNSEFPIIPINFFKGTPHLDTICLSNSKIKNLQVGAFAGLQKLAKLQLDNNELKVIRNGCLNTLWTLRILDLEKNGIETLEKEAFLGLTSLESLDLSGNQIRSLSYDLLSPLENLEILILSYNHLTSIDVHIRKLSKLNILFMNNNAIESIQNCFNDTIIVSLFLQDNEIFHINNSCFPETLTNLNIANNNITSLTFLDNLSSLSTLNLSRNRITETPLDIFENLGNLLKLDMSQNEMSALRVGIFSRANHIEYLNLSRITSSELDPHTLIPLSDLKILDISHNNLNHWDSELFNHIDNFRTFFLEGNNFTCNVVSSLIQQSKLRNFSLVYEKNYSVENIKGIPCIHKRAEQPKNATDFVVTTNHQAVIHWQELWNYVTNLTEVLNETLSNYLVSEESIVENLEGEISEKIETYLETRTEEQNIAIRSEFMKLHDVFHNIVYRKTEGTTKTLTSNEQHQDPSFKEFMYIMEQKMTYSLHRTNILIILGFLILVCIFVTINIVSFHLATKGRKQRYNLEQELPVLSS